MKKTPFPLAVGIGSTLLLLGSLAWADPVSEHRFVGRYELTGAYSTTRHTAAEVRIDRLADGKLHVTRVGRYTGPSHAGHPPFTGEDLFKIMDRHINESPPSLQESSRSVDPRIAAIVHQCLAKAPGERPPTAKALWILFSEIASAPPPPSAVAPEEDDLPQDPSAATQRMPSLPELPFCPASANWVLRKCPRAKRPKTHKRTNNSIGPIQGANASASLLLPVSCNSAG